MTTSSSPDGDRVPLLRVDELRTHFHVGAGVVTAVDGVSFEVRPGEIVGVVGESGCGKTVMALSILGLLEAPGRVVGGSVRLAGAELVNAPEAVLNEVRGRRIAMIFQQPQLSLDPVMAIGKQIGQALPAGLGRAARRNRAVELLDQVGIPDPKRRERDHPHQLSGGMAQRVMIAIALAGEPDLLIADEPTTALDVTVQAQILGLLQQLQATHDMAIMLITHDLDVVGSVADRVTVMYAGQIVEDGDVSEIYDDPRHPYTRALLGSRPTAGAAKDRLRAIRGGVPVPVDLPPGCRFAPRCDARLEAGLSACTQTEPGRTVVGVTHGVRCWLHE